MLRNKIGLQKSHPSHLAATGASLKLSCSMKTRLFQYKDIPSSGSIGLGKAEKIQQLEVFWPTTGKTQSLRKVPMDCFIKIVEGQKGFTTLSVRKLKLGTNH